MSVLLWRVEVPNVKDSVLRRAYLGRRCEMYCRPMQLSIGIKDNNSLPSFPSQRPVSSMTFTASQLGIFRLWSRLIYHQTAHRTLCSAGPRAGSSAAMDMMFYTPLPGQCVQSLDSCPISPLERGRAEVREWGRRQDFIGQPGVDKLHNYINEKKSRNSSTIEFAFGA